MHPGALASGCSWKGSLTGTGSECHQKMNQTAGDPLGEKLTFLLLYFLFKTVTFCQCELGFLMTDREGEEHSEFSRVP